MYSLIRRLLFRLDPEVAHDQGLWLLSRLGRNAVTRRMLRRHAAGPAPQIATSVWGKTLANPLGLAAGLDKNAVAVDAFASLGFGWIEVGTVTPRPQSGNPKPRMFRLADHGALINRMGFNGAGVATFLANLRKRQTDIVVGINIGKNAATDNDNALHDYTFALQAVYADADYVVVNISSPNTVGLRQWQQQDRLAELLNPLKDQQQQLAHQHGKHVPLVVKIAPDLEDQTLAAMASVLNECKIDGVIATNTTVSRPGLAAEPLAEQSGGLSGRPLAPLAERVSGALNALLPNDIAVIGCGGIDSAVEAHKRLQQGCAAIQLYTGLIYNGPRLAANIVRGLHGYNPSSTTQSESDRT